MGDSRVFEVTLIVMITLSRLNNKKFVLNCELIKTLEAAPDTIVTLINGEKLMVRESLDEVVKLSMDYRKRLYQEPPTQVETVPSAAFGGQVQLSMRVAGHGGP